MYVLDGVVKKDHQCIYSTGTVLTKALVVFIFAESKTYCYVDSMSL